MKSHKLTALQSQMKIEAETVAHSLENFIREHVTKLEREGVILGLSGGLDSAVVAALCQRAVGPGQTLALIMPEKDSRKEHITDALDLARELKIETRFIDISSYLKQLGAYQLFALNRLPLPQPLKGVLVNQAYRYYARKTGEPPFAASLLGFKDKEFGTYLSKGIAYCRLKHRLRMMLLYLYGELENRLVVGTANRTEHEIGLFVKHGCDDATDVMPLLNLYKTQVMELATYLKIPSPIISKNPSPDIIPGLIDEEVIGIPYAELDLILLALANRWPEREIAVALKIGDEKINYIKNLRQKSAHMRQVYTP